VHLDRWQRSRNVRTFGGDVTLGGISSTEIKNLDKEPGVTLPSSDYHLNVGSLCEPLSFERSVIPTTPHCLNQHPNIVMSGEGQIARGELAGRNNKKQCQSVLLKGRVNHSLRKMGEKLLLSY
jgi:hypothetical protein